MRPGVQHMTGTFHDDFAASIVSSHQDILWHSLYTFLQYTLFILQDRPEMDPSDIQASTEYSSSNYDALTSIRPLRTTLFYASA